MDLIIETEKKPEPRKAGRQKGDIYNKKNKFKILYYNHINKNYDDIGDYPTLRQASATLNINYNLLSNLNLNRSKNQSKYYKIIKL